MSHYDDIKAECYEANLLLPEYKLIDLTFGNVSVAEPERRVFAIKPSGVDYRSMKVDDMVVVDFEGKLVEGSLRPSSDTPTHQRLFKAFTGIRSVVHTHSRNAVAFATNGKLGTSLSSVSSILTRRPCAPYLSMATVHLFGDQMERKRSRMRLRLKSLLRWA
jgi:L-ribulose-5-phosphate 4-epimerase